MLDIRLALLTGVDIALPDFQIVLHQPTMKEISYIGEHTFFTGIQCICVKKSMVQVVPGMQPPQSNFAVFSTLMNSKETKDKKQETLTTLSLLLPNYQIVFTPRSMLLNNGEIKAIIDESNFDTFQSICEEICCLRGSDQSTFNPGNEAARKIAEKLMRARERVAAQKAGSGEGSTLSQYHSTLTIGVPSLSLADCINLTIYQLYDLVERYRLYTNWDIDLRVRLAGGKPDNETENWMKNIH